MSVQPGDRDRVRFALLTHMRSADIYDACSIPATRVLAILYALRDEGEVTLTVGHLHEDTDDDNQLCQCPDDIGARLVSEWQLDDSN